MQFFRIKIGQDGAPVIEPYLEWQRLDGISYIPVGGLGMSYLTVAPDFQATERTGRLTCGNIAPSHRGGIELVPQGMVRNGSFIPDSDGNDDRAFVVVPSGAFDFDVARDMVPCTPRDRMQALSVVLKLGDVVKAMAKVRTIREMDKTVPLYLAYHGSGRLTFNP